MAEIPNMATTIIYRKSNPTSATSSAPPIKKKPAQTVAKKTKNLSKAVSVVLRLPAEVLSQIDQVVDSRRIRIPRHTWLLEAVLEKLDRES